MAVSQSEGMSIFHDCILTIRDKLNFQLRGAVVLAESDHFQVMDLFTRHPKIEQVLQKLCLTKTLPTADVKGLDEVDFDLFKSNLKQSEQSTIGASSHVQFKRLSIVPSPNSINNT